LTEGQKGNDQEETDIQKPRSCFLNCAQIKANLGLVTDIMVNQCKTAEVDTEGSACVSAQRCV